MILRNRTGWRRSATPRHCMVLARHLAAADFSDGFDANHVAVPNAGALERARRQFDDRERAPGCGDSPGAPPPRIFTTRPSRATNATSIAKRMKNVWIALVGAMTRALSSGRASCFS